MTEQEQKLHEQIEKLIKQLGFRDASVEYDSEARRFSIIVDEGEWLKKWIPDLVKHLKHLVDIFALKNRNNERYYIDINNYRKERERLIAELSKVAAKKAVTQKKAVKLPAMNAYERRLVHMELAMRPDVETESQGEGRDRYVVVKMNEL